MTLSRKHFLGLIKEAYLDSKKSHEEGGQSWFSALSNMFNVLKTPGGYKYKSCSISSLRHTVKTELKNMYIGTWYNLWNQLINENGKLRTYVQIKTNFGFEKYLDIIKEHKNRRYITKFKISSHKLKIEAGRYTRPITPLNERICDRYDNHEVDDEIHFFNHCTHLLEARKTLFDLINKSYVNFQSLSYFQKNFWTFNILNNLSMFLLESAVT